MNNKQLKSAIKCLHRIYYKGDILRNERDALEFHKHMSVLFDFAEITSSLAENNPGMSTTTQWEAKLKLEEN